MGVTGTYEPPVASGGMTLKSVTKSFSSIYGPTNSNGNAASVELTEAQMAGLHSIYAKGKCGSYSIADAGYLTFGTSDYPGCFIAYAPDYNSFAYVIYDPKKRKVYTDSSSYAFTGTITFYYFE